MRKMGAFRIFSYFWALLLLAGIFVSCNESAEGPAMSLRFAVASDPHLYATDLGTEGPEFTAVVEREQKLLDLSVAIFSGFVTAVLAENPPVDFVLIPGDLTKDGELRSHQEMAAQLARLHQAGIGAYIIPGNHDVANPEARGYSATGSFAVPGVSAPEFTTLYADFGYGQALDRDPASLSYISELAPDVWLMAIDTCRYVENGPQLHEVGGRIHPATLRWLIDKLREARQQNILAIGMMHHGLTEHYRGQGEQFPDFLVEDWPEVSHQLALEGLNLVFTGHFHAQDIVRNDWPDGAFLVDVETGSTAAYPNSYRIATLNLAENAVQLETRQLQDLPEAVATGHFLQLTDLTLEFSSRLLAENIADLLAEHLDMPQAKLDPMVHDLRDATLAHIAGDEVPTMSQFRNAANYAQQADPDVALLGQLLLSLWHDLPPKDNQALLVLERQASSPGQ